MKRSVVHVLDYATATPEWAWICGRKNPRRASAAFLAVDSVYPRTLRHALRHYGRIMCRDCWRVLNARLRRAP